MKHLARIAWRFSTACEPIRRILDQGRTSSDMALRKALLGFAIVRLHDEWSAKCREIILQSASGAAYTRKGVLLGRSSRLLGESPMPHLRRKWSVKGSTMKSTWEPKWYTPSEASRAASLLGLSNEATVTAALGAGTIPDDLRITRNVVVHTLPNTWNQYRSLVRRYGHPSSTTPADFVTLRNTATGLLLFDEWIDSLYLNIIAAVA
jgi:hypothetical protein